MMKPVDGQPGVFTTIDIDGQTVNKALPAPKFKIGDRVRVNLKAARAVGYTGPEVGVINNIDDCCARILDGGKGPFVGLDDLELEFIVGDRVQTPNGFQGVIEAMNVSEAFVGGSSLAQWLPLSELAHAPVVRYKGRIEPSGALAEMLGVSEPAHVPYENSRLGGDDVANWGKDLAGTVKCLRCGGPAGYLGLRCERVGGCRTAEERVGEPRIMPNDRSGSALDWDVFSSIGAEGEEWYATGSGSLIGRRRIAAGPFATVELAIAAWKAVRLAELER